MDVASLVQAGALVFIAFLTATAALLAAFFLIRRIDGGRGTGAPEVAFLFEGDTLVDSTPSARRLLEFASARGSDMVRLVTFLSHRFPDLDIRVQNCRENDRLLLLSADCASRLLIETAGSRMRLTLEAVDEAADDLPGPDRHSHAVLADELAAHRAASDHTSVPIWRLNAEGRVTWANGAYWALAERAGLAETQPPGAIPVLFPDFSLAPSAASGTQRLHLSLASDDGSRWFEITSRPVGRDRVATAMPADALVAAERNLREFIQTLTQTFAHLSVGLAIFDRKRQLTLFNPALGDLLGFDVEFLVARPSLTRFLDHLRERHMMPEPKDYKTWRQKMSELEAAAAEGGHSETWSLPDGRTFRITGRPHPDGAVAFLFEDISAEIAMSQEYRRELETGHAVMDTLEEAIAVFSADGRLTFANRAYAQMWAPGGDAHLPTTFLEASRQWQHACAPSPVWGDARDFAREITGRSTWTADVRHRDGRQVLCRFEPLPGGGTMTGFTVAGAGSYLAEDSAKKPNGDPQGPPTAASA